VEQRVSHLRTVIFPYNPSIHPFIHLWRYSPVRALTSLTRRFHSSLFAALLLHPLIPSIYSASLWTTSTHLVLGLPTGLVVSKFPFRTCFGILSSSILFIWPTHSSLLVLMSSTMFGSLYKLYSSLFHLGCPSHVLGHIFFAIFSFQTCLASALTFVLRSKLTFP